MIDWKQVQSKEHIQAEKEALERAIWKSERDKLVKSIVVDIDGLLFDGDEKSQTRMSRSIVGMDDTDTIVWVMSDNTVAQVNKEQLRRALRASGEKQTELWVKE